MKLNLDLLHTFRFAILLNVVQDSEDAEEEIYAHAGKAGYNKEQNIIEIYKDGVDRPIFKLPENEFDRIFKVEEDDKEELSGADYAIILNVGKAPGNNTSELKPLGFKMNKG